jgi:hypothetical protein
LQTLIAYQENATNEKINMIAAKEDYERQKIT